MTRHLRMVHCDYPLKCRFKGLQSGEGLLRLVLTVRYNRGVPVSGLRTQWGRTSWNVRHVCHCVGPSSSFYPSREMELRQYKNVIQERLVRLSSDCFFLSWTSSQTDLKQVSASSFSGGTRSWRRCKCPGPVPGHSTTFWPECQSYLGC